jgi:photosystem II stability/assembly factor-like uncharacterized protein
LTLLVSSCCLAGEPSWKPAGWGGGGFFWSCAFHPTRDGVIYLGGDVAGAYKTEDKGRHWRFINRGLADYAVYALAASKASPDTLYAGTVSGICKSTDAGEHWALLEETGKGKLDLSVERGTSVRPIVADPMNPRVVYAGSRHGKLYKSEDGGATWRKLDYLQAFAGQPRPTAPPASRGKGCLALTFESEAGDWNRNGRAERGFFPKPLDARPYGKLTAAFFVPAGAPKLQAQLVVQSGSNWLWQQGPFTDGKPGEWAEAALDLEGLQDLDHVHFVYFVVRSPERGYQGEVFLDAVTLHAAAEGDKTVVLGDWEKPGDVEGWRANRKIEDALFVTEVRQSADLERKARGVISSVAVAEGDPRFLFVTSTEYGLLRSGDGGVTWKHLQTPQSATCVAVAASDPKIVYAAFQQEGVRRSGDKGATWDPANARIKPGCSIREVAVDPRDPNTVYCIGAVNWDGYFYRSTDGGRTWEESRTLRRDFGSDPTCPKDYGGRATGTCPLSRPGNLAVNPIRPNELFIAANWRNAFSPDGGRTWEQRDRGADITCVTDIRFVGGRTYVTAMDEGLLVSENGGASWRVLCPLEYSPALSGHQWRAHVSSDGQWIVTTCSLWEKPVNCVVVSGDGGKSFTTHSEGLPARRPSANTMWGQGYARALAPDPTDPNVLYLGIDGDPTPGQNLGGGVFKSTDGGRTWQRLPAQPGSRRMFYGLAVDPTDPRRLYWGACGTGGGLYRSDDGGASWIHVFKNESWVFNVAVSPTGVVYCPGGNLWRSDDHGTTWRKLTNFDGSVSIVGLEVNPKDERMLWLSRVTWGTRAVGSVHESTDGGATWHDITGDLPYVKPTVLRFNPATGELWTGGVGLFRRAFPAPQER